MLGGMPKSSFAAWAATFLALSCNAYASLTVAPGSQSQSARLLTALPNEIAFCVKDASGQPVQGAQVALALSGPTGPHGEAGLQGLSGTLFAGSSCFTSDPYPVYGELPGSYILHATSSYGSADVTVNIVDGARPDHIALLGGTPTAAAGTAFQPFRVQVFDTDSRPLPRAVVHFTQFLDTSTLLTSSGYFDSIQGPILGDLTATADDNGIATPVSPFIASIFPGDGVVTAFSPRGFGVAAAATDIPFRVTAPAAGIPSSYQDMWWGGDAQNGWGISIIEHDRRMFVVIYGYDAQGKPAWYVVPDAKWTHAEGYSLVGTLYQPTGSPYTAFDSSSVSVGESQGTLQIIFLTQDEALLGFFGKPGLAPRMTGLNLSRMTFGAPGASRGVGDMWWGGSSQSGWGISVIEHSGTLFCVWYTYGADGKGTWFVMPGGGWNGTTYSGAIYTTTNPSWAGGHYAASQLTTQQRGTFSLHSPDSNGQMSLDYLIDGRAGTLPLQREPF